MGEVRPLRIIEIGDGLAGSICGRFFSGLGHDVIRYEPPGGDPRRRQPPFNSAGDGLGFVALNADKVSVIAELGEEGRRTIHDLLNGADVAIFDVSPGTLPGLDLSEEWLRQEWPGLVAVRFSGFGLKSPFRDVPGDSLLAEAYGGLAAMIGEPHLRPLSLGGEQTAYCSGVTGFMAAMLGLERRDAGFGGDTANVIMSDVAAYMDWKSDVTLFMSGHSPRRSGTEPGDWRLVKARDGWVGFIFQSRHWKKVVELVGSSELEDPLLADESVRLARAAEWWPVVERWTSERSAEQVYQLAQGLGLPFGWATKASDLAHSAQLRHRGFILSQMTNDGSTPVVGTPVRAEKLPWKSGRAPGMTHDPIPGSHSRVVDAGPRNETKPSKSGKPLEGVVVLDFGTITAGAAATRLLADFGATILKVEWLDHPDTFRSWKMPEPGDRESTSSGGPSTSPYFASNNIGKLGVAINLKSEEGQRLVHQIAGRSHVFVENYRVGVTRRLGIDAKSLQQVNPDLIYLSLSSQGQDGPEARNSSFGSTLDLLSGLASVTGYQSNQPLWSSSDVNYPDQLVSLCGAAFVIYCLQRKITGSVLDVSQREVVSWTLATEIADYVVNGHDSAPDGNHREGRTPHDTYPCSELDTWIAISCSSDLHRHALATWIGSERLANRDATWWRSEHVLVDEELTAWTRLRTREQVISELRAVNVPAVPVQDAADRLNDPGFADRQVIYFDAGAPVKGLPMTFQGYKVSPNVVAPSIGEHTRQVLREMCDLSDEAIDDLEQRGVVYCGTPCHVKTGS